MATKIIEGGELKINSKGKTVGEHDVDKVKDQSISPIGKEWEEVKNEEEEKSGEEDWSYGEEEESVAPKPVQPVQPHDRNHSIQEIVDAVAAGGATEEEEMADPAREKQQQTCKPYPSVFAAIAETLKAQTAAAAAPRVPQAANDETPINIFQEAKLQQIFGHWQYLTREQVDDVATGLAITTAQVERWFEGRREIHNQEGEDATAALMKQQSEAAAAAAVAVLQQKSDAAAARVEEESLKVEEKIRELMERLERNYNVAGFAPCKGKRMLKEMEDMKEQLNGLQSNIESLAERSASICPIWQRTERMEGKIFVKALCDYDDAYVNIRKGDDVILLDNSSDPVHWKIEDGWSGRQGVVPSSIFRIPPPDSRITSSLTQLQQQFEKLRQLREEKHHLIRFHKAMNTMTRIQEWDAHVFNFLDVNQRKEMISAVTDDISELLSEMGLKNTLSAQLREGLMKTMRHYWSLVKESTAEKGQSDCEESEDDECEDDENESEEDEDESEDDEDKSAEDEEEVEDEQEEAKEAQKKLTTATAVDLADRERELKIREEALEMKEESFERRMAEFAVLMDEMEEKMKRMEKRIEEFEN